MNPEDTTAMHVREKRARLTMSHRDDVLSLVSVKATLADLRASVSSCMWNIRDSTFLQVCHAAL